MLRLRGHGPQTIAADSGRAIIHGKMPDRDALLLFIGAGLLLNLTPGPDVLYIVGRSLSQGRVAGVVSALGIGAGCLMHVAAAALGLSALLVAVPPAYEAIRCAGAAYLVWLGVRAWRSESGGLGVRAMERASLSRIFQQGLITNVLNPKVAIFFLAFLPQFTDAARGGLPLQFVVLGLVFVVNGTLVCLAYAVAASSLGDWLKSRYDVSTWLARAMGGLFILLGFRLALGGRT
jgi:threonine/homoserine/homoserine lactone efflux protein